MRRIWLGLLFLLLVGGYQARPVQAATKRPAVTVYLHGHHGDARSMLPLMLNAERQVHATPALKAVVDNDGRVTFFGRLTTHTKRPMVQVIFMNNQAVDYHLLRQWLHNVMADLAERYGVRRVNFVAHSLGNTAVEWYLLRWGRDPTLPRVKKWVAIAGNFDGIPRMHMQPQHNSSAANGKPRLMAPDFREALLLRRRFPAVTILNLYGDLEDGSGSDGVILNASSRALKFLVRGQAKYQEQRIIGRLADHRGLRFNGQVATLTDQFLW